jgi:short-subunit dehydrogenase
MKSNKIVLVTGATSGIGRHAALHLAKKGYRVFATGRKPEVLAEVQKEAEGTSLEILRLDVADADSVELAKQAVLEQTGGYGVDVLINNAGYGTAGPTEMCSDEDMRRQYDVNVFGLMAVTRAFLPQMRERGSGRVINVSSIGGKVTFPFFGVYNSTKFAVESLTDALRMELRPFGIQFVLIEPGAINTGFADRSMSELDKYRTADSPWALITDRADELREMAEKTAVGPHVISRAIERAITARRPRPRYMAPFSARLTVGFVQRLPTRMSDWIMRRITRLSPKHLGLSTDSRHQLRKGESLT